MNTVKSSDIQPRIQVLCVVALQRATERHTESETELSNDRR